MNPTLGQIDWQGGRQLGYKYPRVNSELSPRHSCVLFQGLLGRTQGAIEKGGDRLIVDRLVEDP